jgi:hypothetical protein
VRSERGSLVAETAQLRWNRRHGDVTDEGVSPNPCAQGKWFGQPSLEYFGPFEASARGLEIATECVAQSQVAVSHARKIGAPGEDDGLARVGGELGAHDVRHWPTGERAGLGERCELCRQGGVVVDRSGFPEERLEVAAGVIELAVERGERGGERSRQVERRVLVDELSCCGGRCVRWCLANDGCWR